MKKLGFLMLLVALAAMLGGTALAQDNSAYFVTYYSNANTPNAPDATVRVVNDGDTGANLYAEIYVFDDSEELTQCCSCLVTPDGVLSESVNLNLTANPITGHKNTRGFIEILSSPDNNPFDVEPEHHEPVAGLRAWATHVQGTKVTLSPGNPVVPVVSGPWFVTETQLADANHHFGDQEDFLGQLCYFDSLLSGKPCTCQLEDFDF